MQIEVELQAYLAHYLPDSPSLVDLAVPDGATVDTVIRQLGIPKEMASVIVVNQENGRLETVLKEGDKLTLIPPLAGG